ncbi:MAG: hypothetical protein HRU41_02440 [Saprospiraceae bacterium]|nr:hypothetical protein [Saprospiraceae bacterium]
MRTIIIAGSTVMLGLLFICLQLEQSVDRKYKTVIVSLSEASPSLPTEKELLKHCPILQQVKRRLTTVKQLKQQLGQYSQGPVSKDGRQLGAKITSIRKTIEILLWEADQLMDQVLEDKACQMTKEVELSLRDQSNP